MRLAIDYDSPQPAHGRLVELYRVRNDHPPAHVRTVAREPQVIVEGPTGPPDALRHNPFPVASPGRTGPQCVCRSTISHGTGPGHRMIATGLPLLHARLDEITAVF
jgi:hypothetical protein